MYRLTVAVELPKHVAVLWHLRLGVVLTDRSLVLLLRCESVTDSLKDQIMSADHTARGRVLQELSWGCQKTLTNSFREEHFSVTSCLPRYIKISWQKFVSLYHLPYQHTLFCPFELPRTNHHPNENLLHCAYSESLCHADLSTPSLIPVLLGAFAKSRKANISFIMSVRPTVYMEQAGSHWTEFYEI